MRKTHLSLDNTITLCGDLTEGPNGRKLCHNPYSTAAKHPKSISVSFLPFHAYLILPGSFILHPFPLFCYYDFSQENINKPKQTPVMAEEAARVRVLCNTSHSEGPEEESLCILALPLRNTGTSVNPRSLLPKACSDPLDPRPPTNKQNAPITDYTATNRSVSRYL